ncbi:MAG TPA: MFS transporter [Verrucomicrobiae bacterium]|nr:MFS transporter [Verrucomicrobiae bacterium]
MSDSANVPAEGKHDPYGVLRNRDLRFYFSARLIGIIGQQMFFTALGWEIYDRTGSALLLGFVGLSFVIPMILCTLLAGHFADIYNRKRIIVIATLIMAGANVDLAVISATQSPVYLIFPCLIVIGAARTFLAAASASFLPQLVERKELSRAVNWSATIFQASSIIGPLVGGKLLHLTDRAAPVYALNAVAAITCAFLVSRLRIHHVPVIPEKMSVKTLLTGFDFVFANRIILGIILLDMLAVLLGGATALLPVFAKEILKVEADGLGMLQAALPMGASLCSFVLAHRAPMQNAGRSLLLAVTVFGLATVGFGLSHWFWLSFAMLFACGAADNVSVVVRHTLVQLLTPDEKRGRVSAVNNLFIGTSNEMGEFESGTVAHWFGPALGNTIAFGAMASVVSGGIGTILVVFGIAWFWPEIRKYGRLDA